MAQSQTNPLEKKLSEIHREAEERDAERRAKRLGLAYANLAKVPISIEAVGLIPEAEAKEAKLAAVELKVRDVALAAYDPKLPAAEKLIRGLESKDYKVKVFMSSLSGLEQAWRLYKFIVGEAKEITGKVEIEKKHLEELLLKLTSVHALKQELERVYPVMQPQPRF